MAPIERASDWGPERRPSMTSWYSEAPVFLILWVQTTKEALPSALGIAKHSRAYLVSAAMRISSMLATVSRMLDSLTARIILGRQERIITAA